ncbi:MAG: hypothetical protein JSS71_08605 [Armatimonadetes bacterium]|nr:hypothetical protein [Armatimonadota bacterium]MBX3109676.1 hypothetical protein [Fimbriimonadaceae bacterium]
MNFEFRNNLRTWNLACYALATVVAAIAIAHAVLPMPNPEAAKKDGKGRLELAKSERDIAQKELDDRKAGSAAIWEGQAETVTPQVLQSVTMIAKTQGVNLKSFRPQNPVADGNLARVSYSVMVDGPFPKVVAFIRALDSESSRLGVNLVQMASVDQESDNIGATIGVIAFVRMPEATKQSPTPAGFVADSAKELGTPGGRPDKVAKAEEPSGGKNTSQEPNTGQTGTSTQGSAKQKNGGN